MEQVAPVITFFYRCRNFEYMRIFALSDIHIDYDYNARWIRNLSSYDYTEDVLVLAGDVTHKLPLMDWCMELLAKRMKHVLFVPGNHDLWVLGEDRGRTSLDKFNDVSRMAASHGVLTRPLLTNNVFIAPLLGWYDYSFGFPGKTLTKSWMDYRACRWPGGQGPVEMAAHFLGMNPNIDAPPGAKVISFSHFLPRIDLIPAFVPTQHRVLDPVLGTTSLDKQLRRLGSTMHVYGHSHLNRTVTIDGVTYINNAFGYPQEDRITAKRLMCIHEI